MKKVISRKNLPTQAPVLTTAIVWLLLDRLAAPGWFIGVVWTLVGLLWLAFIVNLADELDVDIFKDQK